MVVAKLRPIVCGCICVVALLVGARANAVERLEGGQATKGFALELHLGTQTVITQEAGQLYGTVQGGLFFGYKLDRVLVGFAFDLLRASQGASATGAPDSTSAQTLFMFVPGVRVAILRSADQRVELFGEFDFGIGHQFHERNTGDGGPDHGNVHLLYQIGPGLRYWIHPQFALGVVGGLEGNFDFESITDGANHVSTSVGLTSLFGNLQFLGVF